MSKKSTVQYLDRVYQRAEERVSLSIDPAVARNLDTIAENRERCRAVLAVIVTLMLKKIISPAQDIRKHQAGMAGGFSARSLDAGTVTPFLKDKDFPYMVSGAGALTRSLEQAVPYDKNYTGRITPKHVKEAFLLCVDAIQTKNENSFDALAYLFTKLIEYRDLDRNIKLIKPINLSIKDIVSKVCKHFDRCGGEGSELPVLAIYAVYMQLVVELKRYRDCVLCDLREHTASDGRAGFLGDIQVNGPDNKPFEIVEIKHKIKLSSELVNACYQKFKSVPVKTYYLLSTDEILKDQEEISAQILRIQKNHGCQMIVNGLQTSLKYYLRLLANPDDFLHRYVGLLESRSSYSVKMQWQADD